MVRIILDDCCNLDRLATSTLLAPSQYRKVPKPYNLGSLYWWLPDNQTSRQIKLLEFSDVMVSWDSVVFRGLRISQESIYGEVKKIYSGFTAKFHFFRKNYLKYKTVKVAKALLITDPWSLINYYHWTLQAISRLASVHKIVSDDTVIILPYSKYRVNDDVIYSTLKVFGFEGERVVRLEKNQNIKAKKLLLSYNAGEGEENFDLINVVRDKILSYYYEQLNVNFGERIYISRSKASSRKIENEDEVIAFLKGYGFEIVNMEEHSFLEQVSIVKNAKYVISSHGAGLTNIMFMKKDGFVVELIGEGVTRAHFYYIAAAIDVKYLYRKCRKSSQDRRGDNANIIVDICDLREDLNLINLNTLY